MNSTSPPAPSASGPAPAPGGFSPPPPGHVAPQADHADKAKTLLNIEGLGRELDPDLDRHGLHGDRQVERVRSERGEVRLLGLIGCKVAGGPAPGPPATAPGLWSRNVGPDSDPGLWVGSLGPASPVSCAILPRDPAARGVCPFSRRAAGPPVRSGLVPQAASSPPCIGCRTVAPVPLPRPLWPLCFGPCTLVSVLWPL